MKIRIKANFLRYRLTQSDVAKLWSEGFLEERTEFSGKALIYAIVTGNDDTLSADFIADRIVLDIPKTMIDELYNTDSVGFDDLSLPVSLLVEKDFGYNDKVEEDQSKNYPQHSTCY